MINLFPTGVSPVKEFIQEIVQLEKEDPAIVSISFIHGFIWGDVADLGAKILVYTDQQLDLDGKYAEKIAAQLGKKLYAMRENTRLKLTSTNELVEELSNVNAKHPIVVGDFSDNPGLGGMGDATFILKAILDANIKNVVFAAIYDPDCVDAAFRAGIGKTIPVKLGGNFGAISGNSIKAHAKVIKLNPELTQIFSGLMLRLGRAAALEVKGNIVIVNSLRSQIYLADTITNMKIIPKAF